MADALLLLLLTPFFEVYSVKATCLLKVLKGNVFHICGAVSV